MCELLPCICASFRWFCFGKNQFLLGSFWLFLFWHLPLLGIGYWGVPFVIGVLWVSVSYACNQVSMNLFPHTTFVSIPAAAFLMTGFDYMIEPFAVRYGLWSWKNGVIPDFNYYTWFGISLILSLLYQKIVNEKSNSITAYFLLTQILFFVGLRMIK
ncbi:MAG: carotenoid biosynthesis protein [Bacteroidetes bacterium]|nr:MAG: carotenoid biosynthesis protein [Bacteroidota bacterium]